MTYCAVSYRQAIGASCIRPQAGMSMCAHSENNHYCGTEFGLIETNPTKGQCMIACATPRRAYHKAIRRTRNMERDNIKQKLAEHCDGKKAKSFWQHIRSVNGVRSGAGFTKPLRLTKGWTF